MSAFKIHISQIKTKALYDFLDNMGIAYIAYVFPVGYIVIGSRIFEQLTSRVEFII